MKKLLLLVALLAVAATASAQLKFGLKGGVNITNMHYGVENVSAADRTGFYVGPTMKYITPRLGLGFDLSLLYDQRQGEAAWNENLKAGQYNGAIRQQQISVPINLRWEWNFSEVIGIFIYGGPEYDLNVSKDIDEYDWRWQTSHWSANLGVGVMLVEHLQINANYNFACDRGGRFHNHPDYGDSRGRFNAWQIGIALYL